ncbi:Flp pilus assembly protein CpaB [Paludisphaera sp.]|uniref:Flp pilus assembly protein CpaB n=1 Tax=Paludisphaera sp. TaxID=2017432 RepID=UPI00301C0D44
MRPQTLAVVMLALVSGLAAVWGVRSSMKKPAAPAEETVAAVVALDDLARGEPIDAARVEIREIPKSRAPEGRLASLEEATSRTPSIPMLKGEFVIEPKLLPKGSRPGMASMIPAGMRAFTIQTPSFSSSLAGLIQPGNRVDVLLTITPSGSRGDDDATTTTLLQNIELLAVHTTVEADAGAKADPNGTRSVTLLVTPRQAAILDLGQNKGTLHLALRNGRDEAPIEETTATLADLGLPPATPPAPAGPIEPPPPALAVEPEPEPVVLTIRTLRGTLAGRDQITVHQRRRAAPRPTAAETSTAAAAAVLPR